MSSPAASPPLLARVRFPPPLHSSSPSSSLRLLPSLSPLNLAPKTLSISIPSTTLNPSPLLILRHRRLLGPSAAAESDTLTDEVFDSNYLQWDSITAKFAAAANVPFLLLQLPQIVLNAQNLLAGNKAALFAVPWLGMLTGLLGNLSLLSYFAKKKETEAVVVQTLGVISTYAVIVQLAMAESMPLPHFLVTSVVVASGLFLNFLNYVGWLNEGMWRAWEDFITVGGLSVLPQVMWTTFVPFIPNSMLPGILSCAVAVAAVVMARTRRLSEKGTQLVQSASGWTATLLFMWMPVAQMWTNYLNPDNIRGLSAFTMLLAMLGNGLMIPRALFIRDFMWFTGSAWASFLHGWGNLLCMYRFKSISKEFFLAATLGFSMWIGMVLWRDTIAYGNSSPMKSLKELVSGSR